MSAVKVPQRGRPVSENGLGKRVNCEDAEARNEASRAWQAWRAAWRLLRRSCAPCRWRTGWGRRCCKRQAVQWGPEGGALPFGPVWLEQIKLGQKVHAFKKKAHVLAAVGPGPDARRLRARQLGTGVPASLPCAAPQQPAQCHLIIF